MSGFKAKMHQIRFRLGLCPRPRWGSLQRSPDPLNGFKGPTSKGREGRRRGMEWKWKGEGREGNEREGEWVSSFLTAHQHIKGYFVPSRLLWNWEKLVYRLIVMFLFTEIFSKRRKIYTWIEEKPGKENHVHWNKTILGDLDNVMKP